MLFHGMIFFRRILTLGKHFRRVSLVMSLKIHTHTQSFNKQKIRELESESAVKAIHTEPFQPAAREGIVGTEDGTLVSASSM